jgi:hypothetical protein
MMRIAKYPHLPSFGVDFHMVITPPLPAPLPPVPSAPFAVSISMLPSSLLTGKFTVTTLTEFQLDTLVGHDWGMLQVHVCMLGPYALSPSNITATLGSKHKYFLPCTSVKEMTGGGLLNIVGASGTPVAVTSPAFVIPLEDCQDINGVKFVWPTGVGLQLPSMRWVGFSLADLVAAVVMLAVDSLISAVVGKVFPAKAAPSTVTEAIKAVAGKAAGAAVGAAIGAAINIGKAVMAEVQSGKSGADSAPTLSAPSIAHGILSLAHSLGFGGGELATEPPSAGSTESAVGR